MANHKRKKSKRSVRCTICTPWRWLGNSSERTKKKYRPIKEKLGDRDE